MNREDTTTYLLEAIGISWGYLDIDFVSDILQTMDDLGLGYPEELEYDFGSSDLNLIIYQLMSIVASHVAYELSEAQWEVANELGIKDHEEIEFGWDIFTNYLDSHYLIYPNNAYEGGWGGDEIVDCMVSTSPEETFRRYFQDLLVDPQ